MTIDASSSRFDNRRALVVGGATGMGAAMATLVQDGGVKVVVMESPCRAAGVKAIRVALRDRDSIDFSVDECGGPIDTLFACAGAADSTPGIEKSDFIGHRT